MIVVNHGADLMIDCHRFAMLDEIGIVLDAEGRQVERVVLDVEVHDRRVGLDAALGHVERECVVAAVAIECVDTASDNKQIGIVGVVGVQRMLIAMHGAGVVADDDAVVGQERVGAPMLLTRGASKNVGEGRAVDLSQ